MSLVSPYVAPACEIAWCLDGFAEYERELEEVVMRAWTLDEVKALKGVADRLGTEPEAILAVMANESGCNPAAHGSVAVGLIQFEPDTLRGLGWTQGTDAFAKLDVLEQLPYVERFYASRPHSIAGLGTAGAYVAAFLPSLIPHASDPDYVLCGAQGPIAWAYAANKTFDRDRKGSITVQDLVDAAEAALNGSECGRGILTMLMDDLSVEPEAT